MRRRWTWTLVLAVLAIQIPTAAQALECPIHFAEMEMLIVKAKQALRRMNGGQKMAVLSDIREAEMTLIEARFHHEREGNEYHHSRAIIRAGEARGYVMAALALSREHTD